MRGLTWRAAWSALTQYAADDAVQHGGSTYIAVLANIGDAPPSSSWNLLADRGATGATGATGAQGAQGAQGPAGPQGSQGPQGETGATGAQGATGSQGPQGARGLTWRAAWSALTQYAADDAVQHGGSTYIAVLANIGDAPPSSSWNLLADRGATGATGATGAQGAQGPQGATGAQGATGPQGDEGPEGPAGPQGPEGPQGPQGATGAQGPTGSRGPAVFAARANSYSGSTMYAPVTGIATVTATETDVELLSPNASLIARDLAVRTSSAMPVAASVTITLRDDGADTSVTCTVAALGTTCNSSAASATVAAGSRLSLKITSTGVVTGLSLLVGWQAA